MSIHDRRPTIIIGAGIIGAATACDLQRRGENVVLVERDEPGRGTSYGNMASIAVDGFAAISRPSTWKKIPKWMLNPEAPVCVDPRYMPKMVPWFMKFLAAGSPKRVAAIEEAGASLALRVPADIRNMLAQIGALDLLSRTTCLNIFGSEAEFAASGELLAMMRHYGLQYAVLEGQAIRDLEPQLNAAIKKAVLLPDNNFILDPYKLVVRLADAFQAAGGNLVKGQVADITRANGGVTGIRLTDGRLIEGRQVLVAAGMGSRDLARAMGEPIPLETERGYHTQIMAPGIDLAWSIIWHHRAFMITPTAGGIRVGGSVEMAGLDRAPNYRRARVLVEHARYALPRLKVEETSEWMGHRPALPDTIPVLSPSAKTRGLFYATGHGHLGLTYSATTARLMSDLLTGVTPPVDLTPFRIDRF